VSPADLTAEFEARERRRLVRQAVAGLSVVDRRVVRLRFGLDGIRFSLGEVGWLLRVSAERVRQIEARALRRLRRAASTNRLAACAAAEEG
jgi:RNA polymerase sigma factor (sigma-70 family)